MATSNRLNYKSAGAVRTRRPFPTLSAVEWLASRIDEADVARVLFEDSIDAAGVSDLVWC